MADKAIPKHTEPDRCPVRGCGVKLTGVVHLSLGALAVKINGRTRMSRPRERLTFYPCRHSIEREVK
jgi:hypothetical protein